MPDKNPEKDPASQKDGQDLGGVKLIFVSFPAPQAAPVAAPVLVSVPYPVFHPAPPAAQPSAPASAQPVVLSEHHSYIPPAAAPAAPPPAVNTCTFAPGAAGPWITAPSWPSLWAPNPCGAGPLAAAPPMPHPPPPPPAPCLNLLVIGLENKRPKPSAPKAEVQYSRVFNWL